ncbi:RNA polymerase II transcription factor B subunit 5 [Trichophyton rubrum D6]|uniref:General transcription and DNA repair factor IIH subunit TFB5 n=4 Tax=Trichophyton TaxID=5550 RepID=F2SMB0_TRIRC|nr:RNA polymerase II transcription factor B subunit 5 [Trichophyton rubrum CBS 118892]EZF14322.1 RNA polymerase II transcription factor B subunit 5 [Trichophyton rubrum MR850]EZF39813.1 RNA polymerase II transcription factor B subunit 5 [Trichophyton rubrum CBS 100081]EZF50441.1 RNA polymerase II transcription factor B subunit 5 [Trichophyton rubrum CBS 288.86]EZF61034.1 RNA polymerase II transcription factor B subunit 5 [Trichophyton rubrum CBS 289.86]EZF71708.1 RNA polymerase II transcriptio
MPRAVKGVLIECDPSVKAIILKYDRLQNNEYIVEDLEGDDRYLVVKESQLANLKIRLAKAWISPQTVAANSTENLCNQKNPSQSNCYSSTAMRMIHSNPLLHPGRFLSNNVGSPQIPSDRDMTTQRNYLNNPPETPE